MDNLTGEPLLKRRARLARVLDGSGLLLSQELPGTAAAIVEAVRGLGLEGVIAKRKDSLYEPGERSDAWQKLKLENQQEFVIGGYRPGSNGIDALLVGYYDETGLRFAGKVRAGFVPHLRREVFKALKPHHVDECPFVDLPSRSPSRVQFVGRFHTTEISGAQRPSPRKSTRTARNKKTPARGRGFLKTAIDGFSPCC